MPKQVTDPVKALGAAVILRALQDARQGNETAAAWLLSDGLLWLDGLGLDIEPQRIAARIADRKHNSRLKALQAAPG